MQRDAILDAAAQVFRKKGFHGASMSDIAHVVRLQKASLYHHISSKQEILLALLDRALEMLTQRVSEIVAQPGPPDLKLRRMIRAYLEALAENPDLSSVLLFEHRSLERKYRLRHVPHRDQFESLWRTVIEEGIRSRAFSVKDAGMAVRTVMGVLNWTLTWYRPDGGMNIENISDYYADMLLNGFLRH